MHELSPSLLADIGCLSTTPLWRELRGSERMCTIADSLIANDTCLKGVEEISDAGRSEVTEKLKKQRVGVHASQMQQQQDGTVSMAQLEFQCILPLLR